MSIVTTFLGAHALPPEANGDKDAYIATVCDDMLPAIAREGLADAVDGFCEEHRVLARADEAGFRGGSGGRAAGQAACRPAVQFGRRTGLPPRHGALSADHLEYTDADGVAAMATAGTVAVLLPGAYYVLRETQAPPVALFREHRVPMALATDCNPGTSPMTSLLLVMNMGATLFRLTVEECLAGVTREAARALGRLDEIGTLEPGKWCDLAVWAVERPAELVYWIGLNPLHARVWRGQ